MVTLNMSKLKLESANSVTLKVWHDLGILELEGWHLLWFKSCTEISRAQSRYHNTCVRAGRKFCAATQSRTLPQIHGQLCFSTHAQMT